MARVPASSAAFVLNVLRRSSAVYVDTVRSRPYLIFPVPSRRHTSSLLRTVALCEGAVALRRQCRTARSRIVCRNERGASGCNSHDRTRLPLLLSIACRAVCLSQLLPIMAGGPYDWRSSSQEGKLLRFLTRSCQPLAHVLSNGEAMQGRAHRLERRWTRSGLRRRLPRMHYERFQICRCRNFLVIPEICLDEALPLQFTRVHHSVGHPRCSPTWTLHRLASRGARRSPGSRRRGHSRRRARRGSRATRPLRIGLLIATLLMQASIQAG